VRRLAQTQVLTSAAIAALMTALFCHPRLALWTARSFPIWYLEALLFFGGIVLWSFVFAWHTEYTGRPVFTLAVEPKLFAIVTALGIAGAVLLHLFLDPSLRTIIPEQYPTRVGQWVAMSLFSLAFGQLFAIFAPFAWLIRLFRSRAAATALTVIFGVGVLMLKNESKPVPFPLFATLLIIRCVSTWLAILFYLRGGIILVWWLGLLIEARHLFDL
jgi:hypothetical protein